MKEVVVEKKRTDEIAEIAEELLRASISMTLVELCTAVQTTISRKKLKIDMSITPSVLKPILFAEKRPFCILRVPGEDMRITHVKTKEIVLEMILDMVAKWSKGKVVHIGTAAANKKRA